MFRSARVKLTLFYLAILLAFGLTLTTSLRWLLEGEYARAGQAQRGEVAQLFRTPHYIITLQNDYSGNAPTQAFNDIQTDQWQAAHDRLNRDQAIITIITVWIGGAVSYWFAGRTLRPLAEAHAAQARFAADASHELRTPLASMRVENEVFLRQKEFTSEEAREQIESNLEEVQRLENLSSSLLALTQYERVALELASVKAEEIAKEAAEHAKTPAKAKKAIIKLDVQAAQVRGHHDSLVQLLGILLDNAIKYGPEGGEITVVGRKQSTHYLLQVKDEGPGIAEADLPRVFDRLFRGDQTRNTKTGGYGLGLALAKQIAKANRAAIGARNNDKKGACFEVRLENTH